MSCSTNPLTDEDKYIANEKIVALEKENETLTRKAQKRFRKKAAVTPSNGFINRVFKWHHRRKLDKIKLLLNSLFPKLTQRFVALDVFRHFAFLY
jgi:hypothetical protein